MTKFWVGKFPRYTASIANKEFEKKVLSKIKSNPQSLKLFSEILKTGFKNRNGIVRVELQKMQKETDKQNQRLKNAKDMVLDGDITSSDYKEMKYKIEETLTKLASEEVKLISGIENNSHLIDDGLDIIQKVESFYHSKDTIAKQRIVGSFYPEKLVFEKSGYRTPKTLNVISLLNRVGVASKENKKGKKSDFSVSSLGVESEGFEPICLEKSNII